MKKNMTKLLEQQPQNESITDKPIGNEKFKIITGGYPNIVRRKSDESLNKKYEVVKRKEDNEEYRIINSVILKRKTDKSPVVKRRKSNAWNQSNSNTTVKKTKPDNDLAQDKPMKELQITVMDMSKVQKPIIKLEHCDKKMTYGPPVTKHDMNIMVYIPVDSKSTTQKNIPLPPPLTAVSKFTKRQSSVSSMAAPISTFGPSLIRTSTPITLNTTYSTDIAMLNVHPKTSIMQKSVPVTTAITSSVTNTTASNKVTNVTNCKSKSNSDTSKHMLSDVVTSILAQPIKDTLVSRLTGRLRADGDFVFPTEAGPFCKSLMDNAIKMNKFFGSIIEDTLGDMANPDMLEAKINSLKLEILTVKDSHKEKLSEVKNNTDLMLCEMINNMENEKTRLIYETRKQCEFEKVRAVEEAKNKAWCVYCGKEAKFYCCWNASYCDYPCQQKHWQRHMLSCARNK